MNKEEFDKVNVFGRGTPNTAYAKYFIGDSYLHPLTKPGDPIGMANVTFDPAAGTTGIFIMRSRGAGRC